MPSKYAKILEALDAINSVQWKICIKIGWKTKILYTNILSKYVKFWNKIAKFAMLPSITHKDDHFGKTHCIKIGWKIQWW
jgi:hypothetical protein